ncbi:MAG TPA: hypothetical protein PK876_07335 [Elusimicrobiota bacterium]|nr:hypothetical protein [Elusimicrobiota bacterium]
MTKKTFAGALLLTLLLGIGGVRPVRAADVNKLTQTAMKYYEKGQYNKAMKTFLKIRQVDPNNEVAREYLMLCSQKIVEQKLGEKKAKEVTQEIGMDKQIEQMSPTETLPPAAEQTPDILSQSDTAPTDSPAEITDLEALFQSAKPMESPVPMPLEADPATAVAPEAAAEPVIKNFVPLIPVPQMPDTVPPPENITEEAASPTESAISLEAPAGQTLSQQRAILAKEMERRRLGSENIVELNERRGRIEIMLYMNRLFLPFSDALRDESFVILNHVSSQLRQKPKQTVVLKAIDSTTTQALPAEMKNLNLRRCTVVFSYLLQETLSTPR